MGFRTSKFMTGMKSKKAFKILSVAALAGVATLSVNATAQASDIAEIPTPNAINIALPTPTHGDNAGYTLTEIANKTDSSITLYEVINNEIKPHYYEYTIKDGADVGALNYSNWGNNTHKEDLKKDFIGNETGLYTNEPFQSAIIGDFINNGIGLSQKSYTSGIEAIKGNFIANSGVAISSNHNIANLTANFFDNTGGALFQGNSGYDSGPQPRSATITNSVFINNSITVDTSVNDQLQGYDQNLLEVLSATSVTGGGAINNVGIVSISDSFFANNHSVNGNGGAISTATGGVMLGTQAGMLFGLIGEAYAGVEMQEVKLNLVDTEGKVLSSAYSLKMTIPPELSGEPEAQVIFVTQEEYGSLALLGSSATVKPGLEEVNINISELPEGTTVEEFEATYFDSLDVFDDLDFPQSFAAFNIANTSFIGNYAESTSDVKVKGGAIYSAGDIKISATDNHDVIFKDNYTLNKGVKDNNAIYVARNAGFKFVMNEQGEPTSYNIALTPGILRLDARNGGRIFMYDKISGDNGSFEMPANSSGNQIPEVTVDETPHYTINLTGNDSGHIYLLNDVENEPNVGLFKTNLHLGRENVLDGSRLSLHSGNLYTINNQIGTMNLGSLSVVGDTNLLVDVDLKNQTMDRFTASEYGSHSGNLNVTGMNLLSDAVSDKTSILFAEKGLKDNVTYGGTELPDGKYQTTAYTPIYKYNVAYDNRDEAGYFVFTKGGKVGGSDSFNPAVLGSSSSATVGATATMNQAFNYAFQHSSDHMNIPYLERISIRDRNKYALSITGDATDMGRFSPLYQPSQEEASVWVKPYATFETVGLKNGPKVHNNTYGTLIGFDTEMQSIKRGWDRVFTGYIGYNGASQRYSGIDSTQNGGLIGGTVTMYKGNFFNATTVSVGASVANNQTMYGNEDFAMLLSGIGNKTGYNFEFKEGKLILQPSMLMSYTFVNTFDYTNAAGVRIDNKPLHALQLAPGVKVIGNLKNGWQPYASVQMVWNLMGESNATANGVKLPEMSIKPYVQYGVGLQKRIKDHFTAYGQAMVQNGGRNGVSLTAGFRWALGHDKCKYKVEDKQLRGKAAKQLKSDASKIKRHYEERSDVVISSNNAIATPSARNDNGRKILKQMTPQQRAAYGGKYYNTTRTAKSGSLRQY